MQECSLYLGLLLYRQYYLRQLLQSLKIIAPVVARDSVQVRAREVVRENVKAHALEIVLVVVVHHAYLLVLNNVQVIVVRPALVVAALDAEEGVSQGVRNSVLPLVPEPV